MTNKRPTFKKGPRPTGLAAVAYPYATTEIKLGGKVIGIISPTRVAVGGNWSVGLRVKKTEDDGNPNCAWRWAWFKARPTEEAARKFLLDNWEALAAKYEIVPEED